MYRSIHILLICRISLHAAINTADFDRLFVANDLYGLLKINYGAVLEVGQLEFYFIWVLEELLIEHFDGDARYAIISLVFRDEFKAMVLAFIRCILPRNVGLFEVAE